MKTAESLENRGVPDFSVVVSVLNRVDVIDRCLESLLEQQGCSCEVIVIDGGSTDGTAAVVQRYASALAYWESNRDDGIYHAWNKGLQQARGRWVGFMGADDRFAVKNALANMSNVAARLPPEVTIIYPHAIYMDINGVIHWQSGSPWKSARKSLFQGMMTVPPAVFYRREVFERNGPFDTRFRICGDFDMVLQEAKTHQAEYIDSTSVIVGTGGISWKPESKKKIMMETREALRKNAIDGIPWEWHLANLRMMPAYTRTRSLGGRILRRLGLLPAKKPGTTAS